MITTVIRLPEEEYRLYKELAREQKISVAEYVRRSLRRSGTPLNNKKKNYSIRELGITIKASGGPVDGSVNHDKYYYEAEEEKLRKQHNL